MVSSIFTGVKWLVIGGSFLAYFGMAGAALYQFIQNKIEQEDR